MFDLDCNETLGTTESITLGIPSLLDENDFVVLGDKTKVSKHFYFSILSQVKYRLPDLQHESTYTAKKICGKEFWNTELFDTPERILAGKCIVHIVTHEYVPLKCAGVNSENAQLYQLK